MIVTRFAPSPTGYLHLGHAYSALECQRVAGQGRLLLRFEDIDHTRVREHYYEAIIEDLAWLGVQVGADPIRQLDWMPRYAEALEQLKSLGVVYPCFCTRKDLMEQNLSAPHGRVPNYSGSCRALAEGERAQAISEGKPYSWRLDAQRAGAETGGLTFTDADEGVVTVDPSLLGDVILGRKDIQTSYHIAVVADDAAQGITDVVRGEDLFDSTHVHRLLQGLLGLPEPRYHHHGLIHDEEGKRLAKRHDALAIRTLREQGASVAEVVAMVGGD